MAHTATPTALAVRRFYDALRAPDVPAALAALHPDVVLHVPGRHPLAGAHRGPHRVLAFAAASRAATADGEHIEVLDVLAGAEHAAALCRVTGARPDGRRLDNTTLHLVRLADDGRFAEMWLHNRDQDHVDTFWSER